MKVSEVIPSDNNMTWLDGSGVACSVSDAKYRVGILIGFRGVWVVTKAGGYDTAEVERVPQPDGAESDDLRAAFKAGWWGRDKACEGDDWEPQYEMFRRELAEDEG